MRSAARLSRDILNGILDLCFPPVSACALCGNRLPRPVPLRDSVCSACLDSLQGIRIDLDPASAEWRGFWRIRAAGPYKGNLKQAIWRFKYGGEQHLCQPIGGLMAKAAVDILPFDAVVPVPLHPFRERQRGFNQSLLLARVVANLTKSVVPAGKLIRVRETLPQNSLKPEERRLNVRGAFRVMPPGALAGSRIVLVDDVFTTGSTVTECSRTILSDGAKSVDVVVCAIVEG